MPSSFFAGTDGEINNAARRHAVRSLLGSSTLERIVPWSDETVTVLVSYPAEKYPDELRAWILGPDRLDLDPERVEQVEAEARKVLGIVSNTGC